MAVPLRRRRGLGAARVRRWFATPARRWASIRPRRPELPGALRSADRGTGWALDRLLERDGWAALDVGRRDAHRRDRAPRRRADRPARGDRRHALRRRAAPAWGASSSPRPSRRARCSRRYDPARGAPVPGEYSKYYTGEAYWALARLHRAFPDEGFGEAADRIGAYLATRRDDAEHHWPAIADHWAGYGLSETVRFPERGRPPLTDAEARLRAPAGRAVRRAGPVDRAAVRAVGRARARPRRVPRRRLRRDRRGLHRPVAHRPRGPSAGGPAGPDRRARNLRRRAGRQRTIRRARTPRAPPGRTGSQGAWFLDGETRMDDQQHTLDGTAADRPDRRGVALRPIPSDDAPSGWLWAVALLLALNPARAAFGIPRAGRSSREVARLAAVGGAIGALAVCAAAAVADVAARRARRQRARVPHRRRRRGRAGRRRRPDPPTARARTRARRPARRARPGRDPARGPPRPARHGARRGRRPRRPRDRRRDGGRGRTGRRGWRPAVPPTGPPAGCSAGPSACWPPGSSPPVSCSASTECSASSSGYSLRRPAAPSTVRPPPTSSRRAASTTGHRRCSHARRVLEPGVGVLAGDEQDHDDRHERRDERDAVERDEPDRLRSRRARGDDPRDNGEIRRSGWQLDRRDRSSGDQRRATVAHRQLAACQAPPPQPERNGDGEENDAGNKFDRMSDGPLGTRDQSEQQPPRAECERNPGDEIHGEHADREQRHARDAMAPRRPGTARVRRCSD